MTPVINNRVDMELRRKSSKSFFVAVLCYATALVHHNCNRALAL